MEDNIESELIESEAKIDPIKHDLSEDDKLKLSKQNSRMVTEFKANKLELEAQRNWDLFYKRNEVNFFKDRHWTTREFQELLGDEDEGRRVLLEVLYSGGF